MKHGPSFIKCLISVSVTSRVLLLIIQITEITQIRLGSSLSKILNSVRYAISVLPLTFSRDSFLFSFTTFSS